MTSPATPTGDDAVLAVLAEVHSAHMWSGALAGCAGPCEWRADWTTDDLYAQYRRHVAAETLSALHAAGMVVSTAGLALIAAERARQIEVEGHTPEHDATHTDHHLALAASCYAAPETCRSATGSRVPDHWPWHNADWKPTPEDRVRELVKAGALIAAEIDRLRAVERTS